MSIDESVYFTNSGLVEQQRERHTPIHTKVIFMAEFQAESYSVPISIVISIKNTNSMQMNKSIIVYMDIVLTFHTIIVHLAAWFD